MDNLVKKDELEERKLKIEKKREEYGYKLKEINEDVVLSCPKEIRYWLVKIEPKFRYMTCRPEDWDYRTKFIRSLYNYTCQNQKCGRVEESDREQFHTHHIISLSEGGDNSFENLVCLCNKCHEKHHPYMIWKND